MDIATLQAFIAVAEHQSFSVASTHLYLTQPAISKRIALLEQELETPLFDRIGRTISLTEAGRALLPRAQRIMQEVEDSRRAISNLSGHVGGRLTLGTSHHIGLHRLPPVLRAFTRQYPDVELDMHFMDSEAACRAVEQGELEMAIVTLPLQSAEQLITEVIWPDPLVFVCGKTHPLTQNTHLTLEKLSAYSAILPAHGTYTREVLELALKNSKSDLQVGISTNYLETIKMMVSVGLGWSVLPRTMLSADLHEFSVRTVKLRRDLGLVWHARYTQSNAAQAMREVLLQH